MDRQHRRASAVTVGLVVIGTGIVTLPLAGAAEARPAAYTVKPSRVDGPAGAVNPSTQGSASRTGRFVVFDSGAGLVPADTDGLTDVYVRDLVRRRTTLVSHGVGLGPGTGGNAAVISADGSTVVFTSALGDLVPGDTNGSVDVFTWDASSGRITRESVTSAGAEQHGSGSFSSDSLDVSADGRFITFASLADDLVAGDTNGQPDVFLRDRADGTTRRVSLDAQGGELRDGALEQSTVSDDGRYVGFGTQSRAVPEDTDDFNDAYVRDTVTGAVTWLSRSATGAPSTAGGSAPQLAGDGSVAVFASNDPLKTRDRNQATDVYLRDLSTGRLQLVSLRSDGSVSREGATQPSVSRNGRYVALTGKDLDPPRDGATAHLRVYVRDRALATTTLVSVANNGAVLDGSSVEPRITANGRHVVMASDARASDGEPGRFVRVLERRRWAAGP